MWNSSELLQALSSLLSGNQKNSHFLQNISIDEVFIDSRKKTKNGLFIALKGERNDGHDFLLQAFENGAVAAIVEKIPEELSRNHPQLCQSLLSVENCYQALDELAKFSRKRSKAKIIAITGSVGKTSTKEMLKIAFESQGKTFATSGNFNNHIGLPLSLCNFSADCEYGIFEIGMNHANEIDPLVKILRPHLSAITTVGPVHIEFFENEQGIALAKSEIFHGLDSEGIAVVNADNIHFEFLKNEAKKCDITESNIISFGTSASDNNSQHFQLLSNSIISPNLSKVEVKTPENKVISYEFASLSQAQIFNSLIVVACLSRLGKDVVSGLNSLKNFHQGSGRGALLEVEFDGKKILIIDDTYNASILSVKAGLDYARNIKNSLHKKRLVCALGDMLELGEKSKEIHLEAVNTLMKTECELAILVGENMSEALAIATKNSQSHEFQSFEDSISAALKIKYLVVDGDLLYIKGSRGVRMERLIEAISPQKTSSH